MDTTCGRYYWHEEKKEKIANFETRQNATTQTQSTSQLSEIVTVPHEIILFFLFSQEREFFSSLLI